MLRAGRSLQHRRRVPRWHALGCIHQAAATRCGQQRPRGSRDPEPSTQDTLSPRPTDHLERGRGAVRTRRGQRPSQLDDPSHTPGCGIRDGTHRHQRHMCGPTADVGQSNDEVAPDGARRPIRMRGWLSSVAARPRLRPRVRFLTSRVTRSSEPLDLCSLEQVADHLPTSQVPLGAKLVQSLDLLVSEVDRD